MDKFGWGFKWVLSGRGQSLGLSLERIDGRSIWIEVIGRTSLGFLSGVLSAWEGPVNGPGS